MLVGLIGVGACFSGVTAMGASTEVTAYAAGDVAIDADNFPDENFRKYVLENIDGDGDGKLSESEIEGCEEINVDRKEISDLKGIENFTELKILMCVGNNLSEITLTNLDPAINAYNITNVKGATLSGDKFINITGETITYDYKTGYKDETMRVTLNVISKIMPSEVTIDKKIFALDKWETGTLTAKLTPDNAEEENLTWSSSDTNVATVDSSGNVIAVNHGKALITVETSNGKSASCEVRVKFADVVNESEYYYI